MKIREVLDFGEPHSPRDARSSAPDGIRVKLAPVQVQDRIVQGQPPLASQDILPGGDSDDGVAGDLQPTVHPRSATRSLISTPNRSDLDFIKQQLLQLPRHSQ
jgi:hypothetical protein